MSEVIFTNTETGRKVAYIIQDDISLPQWVEDMIDLMETTMSRKFTETEREWLRQDNLKPLPFKVDFVYEFDVTYEQNEWRETWFENICEKISGHNSGWIAAFIALRFMLTDWEDDNEIEIIDELFNRNKISDPYSFYTAVYCSNMDYRYFQTSEELAKDVVHEDVDLDSWIAEYIDWDGVIDELLYEPHSTWYYNEESCVAIELNDIDTYRYPKRQLLRRHNIIMGDAELLTLEEFEQLNKPPLEPITLEEIMTFLGGDVA